MNPLDRFWPRRGRCPDPTPPRLDEAAAERLVMTALEGIAAGWTAAQLQAHLGSSRDDRAFEGWLANFAHRRWFSDPAAHGAVALGWWELDGGELGKVAGAIGRELQQHASSLTLGAGTTAHETTEVAPLQSMPTPEAGATAMPSAAAPLWDGQISDRTTSRGIKKIGFTRKKRTCGYQERDGLARADLSQQIASVDEDPLVYVDESGMDQRDEYGYSPQGERLHGC